MIEVFCDNCEKIYPCEPVNEYTLNIRGDKITIPVRMYKCSNCGDIFNADDFQEDIYDKAYRIYRDKHGMIQPEEIKKLRKKYHLTQQELSDILGIGIASINRYENGSLQEKSHDNLLQALKNPEDLLKLLEKSKNKISKKKYIKIKEAILQQLDNNLLEKFYSLEQKINFYNEKFRGNNQFSIKKFIGLICHILKRASKLDAHIPKTKLNKLLFYCDFIFYKNHNRSITGMIYARLPYGPCPEKYQTIYGELIDSKIIDIEEITYNDDSVKEIYKLNNEAFNYDFSIEEEKIINEVIDNLVKKTSSELSDISHKEEGYIKTENGKFIDYNFAKNIKVLKN